MDLDDIAFLKKAARSIPRPGFTVFDVGGAKGNWTQLARDTLGHDGAFHVFEPTTLHYGMLRERFDGINEISVRNFAVGSVDSSVDIVVCDNPEWSYVETEIPDDARVETVPMIRLDSYAEQNSISSVEFLKVDTEGHEFEVIRGLGNLINRVRFIQIEYGGTWGREERRSGATIYDLLNYVCSAGFQLLMYGSERTFEIAPSDFIADGQMRNILFGRF